MSAAGTFVPIVLGALGVLGGGGGIWSMLNLRVTRQKMIADAQRVQAETTTALGSFAIDVLLKPLRARIDELEEEVEQLRKQVRQARAAEEEIERLRRKIRQREAEIEQLQDAVAALRAAQPHWTVPAPPPAANIDDIDTTR